MHYFPFLYSIVSGHMVLDAEVDFVLSAVSNKYHCGILKSQGGQYKRNVLEDFIRYIHEPHVVAISALLDGYRNQIKE